MIEEAFAARFGEQRVDLLGQPLGIARTDESGSVSTFGWGRDGRTTLQRTAEFDQAVVELVEDGLADPAFRGILYVLAWGDRNSIYPLYTGKAGRFGKTAGKTSANLVRIRSNMSAFARWGYGNDYHVGEYSFRRPDGRVVFGSYISSTALPLKPGDDVVIAYDPSNAERHLLVGV